MSLLVKTGTYTGNGSDTGSTSVGVGFQPKFVWVNSLTNSATYQGNYNPYFTTDVALANLGGHIMRFGEVNAGFLNSRDNFSGFNSTGFTISHTSTAAYKYLHFSGQPYPWLALGGDDCFTGLYVGNGADNREITDVGFQPIFVLVFSNGTAQVPAFKYDSGIPTSDTTWLSNTGANTSNSIQQLTATGFQLGSSAVSNQSGVTYFYVAIKAGPLVQQSSYNGDNTDDRNILFTTPTFKPNFALIKSRSGNWGSATDTMPGVDQSTYYRALGFFPDYVQLLTTQGQMQVGLTLNASGQTYDYLAFAERVGPFSISKVDGAATTNITSLDQVPLGNIDAINTIT